MAPSCKLRFARFSARLKFQDGAECGKMLGCPDQWLVIYDTFKMLRLSSLPHSAPSWNFSLAENHANLSLQDGATKWHYNHQDPANQPTSQPTSHHPILPFETKTYISATTEAIIFKFSYIFLGSPVNLNELFK